MGTEIYYFSGTGNSLVVARDIAARLNAKLISIASLRGERVQTDADMIGIVFPVHNVVNGGVPSVIREFAANLAPGRSAYIFAVCTCGGGSGEALANIDKILRTDGRKLAAGFTVKMPFNCAPFTKSEEQLKRFQDWEQTLVEICETVAARHEHKIKSTNSVVKVLVWPLGLIMHSIILGNYRKLAKAPCLAFDDAVSQVDQSYAWDDKCDGCGICAKVCPVANIEMADNRPVWLHHCESCLACLVWCPHQAIEGGLLSGKEERYHHPQVKLAEMLQPRKE